METFFQQAPFLQKIFFSVRISLVNHI